MKHFPLGTELLTSKEEQLLVGSLGGAPRPREYNRGPQWSAQEGQ